MLLAFSRWPRNKKGVLHREEIVVPQLSTEPSLGNTGLDCEGPSKSRQGDLYFSLRKDNGENRNLEWLPDLGLGSWV